MHLIKPESGTLNLDSIREMLGDDWPAVNREITHQLSSDVALVNSVSHYIIGGGGKRLRPLLVLLSAALLLTPAFPQPGVDTMAPALIVAGFEFLLNGPEAA